MPRDTNGNFTLDPSNPVSPGTVIETGWANPTLVDIAAAITDSLSRSGSGGMLTPLRFADGTVAAPGIAMTNEPSSGIYRAALNDLRFSIGSQDVLQFAPAGIVVPAGKTFTTPLVTINGTAGALGKLALQAGAGAVGGFKRTQITMRDDLGTGGWNIANMGDSGNSLDMDSVIAGVAANKFRFTQAGAFSASLVTSPAATNLQIFPPAGSALQVGSNGGVTWQFNAASFNPTVAQNNLQNLGDPAAQIKSGYFGTSVVTPSVVAPAAVGLGLGGNNAVSWQIYDGSTNVLTPLVSNTFDLGRSNLTVRSGYFGTSVQTPLMNMTSAGSLANASATNISQFTTNKLLSVAANSGAGNTQDALVTYQASAAGGGAAIVAGRGPAWDTFIDFYANDGANAGAGNIKKVLRIDQTGIVPSFESAEQTITLGSTISLAHSLGHVPSKVLAFYRCKTAEFGYAVGDEIPAPGYWATGGSFFNGQAFGNATNAGYVIAATALMTANRNAPIGQNVTLTNANWKIIVRAW